MPLRVEINRVPIGVPYCIARTHHDRQRTSIEAALQRRNFQRDPVVVDAIAAVHTEYAALVRPVEANARAEIVGVFVARSLEESGKNRIDLVVVADVVDVGIDFVAHAKIERELAVDVPVVLNVSGNEVVVGVGEYERLVGRATANGHSEEQILVIHDTIVIVVEVGEILHRHDPAVLKNTEVELVEHALKLAAKPDVVFALDPIHAVIKLQASLPGGLGDAVGSAVGKAGKVDFGTRGDGIGGVVEPVHAETGLVNQGRADDARPGGEEILMVIPEVLPLGSGDERGVGTGSDGVETLDAIAEGEKVLGMELPVGAQGAESVGERSAGETLREGLLFDVAGGGENAVQHVAILETSEPPGFIFLDRAADGAGVLLAAEGRRRSGIGDRVEGGRLRLKAVVALVETGGAMETVGSGLGDDVDDAGTSASEFGGKTVGGDLEFFDRVLGNVEQHPADGVVVVVRAVDGHAGAAAELAGG